MGSSIPNPKSKPSKMKKPMNKIAINMNQIVFRSMVYSKILLDPA
jgi:hypothetical protein